MTYSAPMRSRTAALFLATVALLASPKASAAPAKSGRATSASAEKTKAKPAAKSEAPKAEKPKTEAPKGAQKGDAAKDAPKDAKGETPKPPSKSGKPTVAKVTKEKAPAEPSVEKKAVVETKANEKAEAPAPKPARPVSPKRAESVRRAISGGPLDPPATEEGESAELRMLREIDQELFPIASRPVEGGIELPAPLPPDPRSPRVHATGLPPMGKTPEPWPVAEGERDLSWLRELQMPDLPARWDARVIRYLEYYRDNPRGRRAAALSFKRSGRWVQAMRRTLRAQGLPEDLVWASLVESGFNPTARSRAGAAGLWQFMPGTARIYGLTVDSTLDERLDPERATEAAARHLGDLYRRFGSWELALAAYNMGYGGLLAAVRKFNTNDYWELGRWESGIPWETTLYVPKIIATAIVARNPRVFGLEDIEVDSPIESDTVPIPPGTTLKAIAKVAGCADSELSSLNPQLLGAKTPRGSAETDTFLVRVPAGTGPAVAKRFAPNLPQGGHIERHTVRFGESIESIAQVRGITKSRLLELNGLGDGEGFRGRSSLLVPRGGGRAKLAEEDDLPVVVIPSTSFEHEGERRVFYRVLAGDTLADIADAFGVLSDDLRRWNALDPSAKLHEGMALQVFVDDEADLARVYFLEEREVRLLAIGSEEFYAHFEGLRGRKRAVVTVQPGDTWQKLGKKYDLTLGQLERINRRARSSVLTPGETVVVYAPMDQRIPASILVDGQETEPEALPALSAPNPEDLPGEGAVAAKAEEEEGEADRLAESCVGECDEAEGEISAPER